jgi:hypothetical protein
MLIMWWAATGEKVPVESCAGCAGATGTFHSAPSHRMALTSGRHHVVVSDLPRSVPADVRTAKFFDRFGLRVVRSEVITALLAHDLIEVRRIRDVGQLSLSRPTGWLESSPDLVRHTGQYLSRPRSSTD